MNQSGKFLIKNNIKIKGINAKYAKYAKMKHAKKADLAHFASFAYLANFASSLLIGASEAARRFMARVQFRAETGNSQ